MLVSKTYEVITEESAEIGEAKDHGFVFRDVEMSMEEVVREIKRGGFSEWSSSIPSKGDWLSTVTPDIDDINREQIYYSLFFNGISDAEFEKILSITSRKFSLPSLRFFRRIKESMSIWRT